MCSKYHPIQPIFRQATPRGSPGSSSRSGRITSPSARFSTGSGPWTRSATLGARSRRCVDLVEAPVGFDDLAGDYHPERAMYVFSSLLAEGTELLHHPSGAAPGLTRARQFADVFGLIHQLNGLRIFRCRIGCQGNLLHAFHGLDHQHSHCPGRGTGQASRFQFWDEKAHRFGHRKRALRVGTGASRFGDFLRRAHQRVLLRRCHRSRPGRASATRSGLLALLCSRVCTPRVRCVLGPPRGCTARPAHEQSGQREGRHRRCDSHRRKI